MCTQLEAHGGGERVRRDAVAGSLPAGTYTSPHTLVRPSAASRPRRLVVQGAADAAGGGAGTDVDLEVGQVQVVGRRATEVGRADDVVTVAGDEQGAAVPVVRVGHHRHEAVPAARDGVLAVVPDRLLLGLPEGAQGRLVGRVDLADAHHAPHPCRTPRDEANGYRQCSDHGTRAPEDPARELVEGGRDRRPPRRHGVRRGGRRRPLDRPGQGRRLRDGDQRRGRHRRDASRRVPPGARGRGGRVGADRRRRDRGVPRAARRDRRVRRAVAADAGRGDPPPPARDRPDRQLPRHLRTRRAQPGRPHRRRPCRARRGP